MQNPQATTPTPTAPAVIAPAPAPARAAIVNQPGTNVYTVAPPLTARDVAAIKARRDELSNQLISAAGRRSRLVEQLNSSTNETARKGIEDRIALLDRRMLQLETDIAETGQQLTSAPAGLVAATQSPPFFGVLGSGQFVAISIVFTILVLAPLAIGAARLLWKRSNRPVAPPAILTETAQRLERLEQAVDAVAIEIERVSEGQRFVTRLLSEGSAAHLPPPARDPVRIGAPAADE